MHFATKYRYETFPPLSQAWLAQSVEHQTFNLRVTGSSPVSGCLTFVSLTFFNALRILILSQLNLKGSSNLAFFKNLSKLGGTFLCNLHVYVKWLNFTCKSAKILHVYCSFQPRTRLKPLL